MIFWVYVSQCVLEWACPEWRREDLWALTSPSVLLSPSLIPSPHPAIGHWFWGLIQFVGEGGREGWMIYWLLYKSRAVAVISFQDAVMRFWPVFSLRWCDFGTDIVFFCHRLCVDHVCFIPSIKKKKTEIASLSFCVLPRDKMSIILASACLNLLERQRILLFHSDGKTAREQVHSFSFELGKCIIRDKLLW